MFSSRCAIITPTRAANTVIFKNLKNIKLKYTGYGGIKMSHDFPHPCESQ